ncbi:MAG: DUF3090 family protein [Anaerolineae bacterium]|nr:DUF3090 family protein [Anaerolineae bacterium]
MPGIEIELNPVSFITVGTIGPKGKREFFLQAGDETQIVSLTIEKEHARALGEAIREMLDGLAKRADRPLSRDDEVSRVNMDLREPVVSRFRVAQLGLGYDEDRDMVILVAQELVLASADEEETEEPIEDRLEEAQPGVARFWATRQQMRQLSQHAAQVIKQGRADPASNGRVLYYWT